MTATATEQVRRLVERRAERAHASHHVLVVQCGDDEVVSVAGGTVRHGGPLMTVTTPFFVASIDKTLIATAVLQLVAEGRLQLATRLDEVVEPELWDGMHPLAAGGGGGITVHQLLAQSTGLPDPVTEAPRGERPWFASLAAGTDMAWTAADVAERLRRIRPHFAPRDPADPRAKVRYGDGNFLLLGAIVERVEAAPLAEVLATRVFAPAGMRHSWVDGGRPLDPATPEPAALSTRDGGELHLPMAMASFPAVYATAHDLIAFLRALGTGRLVPQPYLAVMLGSWRRFGLPRDRAALMEPGWPIEYGLGVMRYQLPRWMTPARAVPPMIGHTGSTGCWAFHVPGAGGGDLHLAGTVDVVGAGALPYRLAPRVVGALTARGS